MPLTHLVGCDEFGAHIIPQGDRKWELKGAQHVDSMFSKDKRQYTGDLAIDAAGNVIAIHMIFAGKTDRSLPSSECRELFPKFVFHKTNNHWCDHASKVAFVERIYCVLKEKEAALKGIPVNQVGPFRCVLLLDCWPVNLTALFRAEIKEKCPGMILFYIPAGGTGTYQVH
ncbi:hypothetical protein BCR33DRAFT_829378 [Rhizoclosmatium globosum]|uniref:DDE-1 domain-containing protein n=1 Tax=Rhizoclosmatium globosum TaxID=329046 RepID=A0A1Y1ZN05_9FUNG|nr:hypothetical protein BCR33DRAFT_829378 [Rhizoclosmatium globosum]|eukprot:ORY11387.1 hypothetical protein BCR33DRAFT_829378 [Rhizoclosmatium globosum]